MRIVQTGTKPLFCRMTYSHTQDSHPVRWAGSKNTCTPSAIVHWLTLLCKMLATIGSDTQDYVFVILKPIQTK